MNSIVYIFNHEFEYDFLSGWIKYLRLEAEISQEALAHGICSVSHLSYFENGKKRLRGELIEALLKKLKIYSIEGVSEIGHIRQKFNRLAFQIEGFDYEAATITYGELLSLEKLLDISPYNIEFKIHKLMYNALVERLKLSELKTSIDTLDKIYESLTSELRYLYMLVTGKFLYDNLNHTEGILRLRAALKLRDTSWINYRLGVALNQNSEPLLSIIHLERALSDYQSNGRYRNSLECHSFLGSSYTALKMYERAELHYKAVLNGSDYFALDKNIFGIYTSLANLYFKMNHLDRSIHYCSLAMNQTPPENINSPWLKSSWHYDEQPILAGCIYVEIHKTLNLTDKCQEIFDRFLVPDKKDSLYYKYLYSLYLSIYHTKEDKFYFELKNNIIPFYKKIGFLNINIKLQYMLIDYLEANRKYKEANLIYKELLT